MTTALTEARLTAIRDELSLWDDEFDSPKWLPATRAAMARAILAALEREGLL